MRYNRQQQRVVPLPSKIKISLVSCPNPSSTTRTTWTVINSQGQSRPCKQPSRQASKTLTDAAWVRIKGTSQKTPFACRINLAPALRSGRISPPMEARVSSSRVVPSRRGMSSQGTATARAIVRSRLQLTVTPERVILMFSKIASTRVLDW